MTHALRCALLWREQNGRLLQHGSPRLHRPSREQASALAGNFTHIHGAVLNSQQGNWMQGRVYRGPILAPDVQNAVRRLDRQSSQSLKAAESTFGLHT